MDENMRRVHQRSVASFQAALTQEQANFQQAQATGDIDEQVRSANQMAGLRASMRELSLMANEVNQPQQQHVPRNSFGLTEEEDEIAVSSFTAHDMTPDQKRQSYANMKNKLATERATGKYPMLERN